MRYDRSVTPSDFLDIYLSLSTPGDRYIKARKIGFVRAEQANGGETVTTSETENTAGKGDYLVTNLDPRTFDPIIRVDGEDKYIVPKHRFFELYEPYDENIFRAKGVVHAIQIGEIDIIAPWGERQYIRNGFLMLNGTEVYGCEYDVFVKTYEPIV